MNRKSAALLCFVLLTASVVSALDQVGNDPSLVYVRVSVSDPEGRSIVGLRAEHFNISEDKTPQQIVSLAHRDIPISAAVMLDVRGQVKDNLKSVATSFRSGGNPANQLFLAEFGDKPLNEGVLEGLNNLVQQGRNPARVFVLLTDRLNAGRSSFSKVKEALKEHDVQFFVIGLAERRDQVLDQEQDVFRDLAKTSGGQAFFPSSVVQVGRIFNTIEVELRHQYVIGYRPANPVEDGKWRKITVTAAVPDPPRSKPKALIARAKSGYYSRLVTR
jgi:Ca-activated chloride channel family protein